jgi:dihydropteroate synthase
MIWSFQQRKIDLTNQAVVMGILNITPDSFSDGGAYKSLNQVLDHARSMIADGAKIIDIGGESTRPGALLISADEEMQRVISVIEELRKEWNGLISIDTTKALVAEEALKSGADIVNDVNGLSDPKMINVCVKYGCGVIVMHRQGDSQVMQQNPQYDDVVSEVRDFFEERFYTLTNAGISPNAICFDPGIGFGKTLTHNLQLIKNLDQLVVKNRPLLLGVSRKSFIATCLGKNDMPCRDAATVAITAAARSQGMMLHRVHEVKANVDALRVIESIYFSK